VAIFRSLLPEIDSGDVLVGLDDDLRIDAELARHRGANSRRHFRRCTGSTGEHRVATVQQGLHVRVAEAFQHFAQVGHGDALRLADIDAAEQRDVARHGSAGG
jgi:hypothetical protein